jgi:hypothetical protein
MKAFPIGIPLARSFEEKGIISTNHVHILSCHPIFHHLTPNMSPSFHAPSSLPSFNLTYLSLARSITPCRRSRCRPARGNRNVNSSSTMNQVQSASSDNDDETEAGAEPNS